MTLLQERFVANVRRLMADRGLSQSQLGRTMNVSAAMVNQYLSGTRSPGLDLIVRFALALEMDEPSDLLLPMVHSNSEKLQSIA